MEYLSSCPKTVLFLGVGRSFSPHHTEAQEMRWDCLCPACQGTDISSVPSSSWVRRTLVLKPPWAPSVDAPQVSSTRWDELEKDSELLLRNPPGSKLSSFLLIFLFSPSNPSRLYLVLEVTQIFQTVHAQRASGFGLVILKNPLLL